MGNRRRLVPDVAIARIDPTGATCPGCAVVELTHRQPVQAGVAAMISSDLGAAEDSSFPDASAQLDALAGLTRTAYRGGI